MSLIVKRDGGLKGPFSFYRGTQRVWFNEEEWAYYRETPAGFETLQGVTNTLRVVDKSNCLLPWGVRKALARTKELLVERGHTVRPDALTSAHPLSDVKLDEILEDARKENYRLLRRAADTGHAAHSWCESFAAATLAKNDRRRHELLAKLPDDECAANCCIAIVTFLADHQVKWIATEQRVLSLELLCCGTLDGDVLISSCSNPVCCTETYRDRRVILDLKTSNGIYPTYLAQTAFYQKAHEEEFPEVRYDGRVILRLGKDDAAEFEAWYAFGRELYQKDLEFFSRALALKRSVAETEAWMGDIRNAKKEAAALVKQSEKAAALAQECGGFKDYKGIRKPRCSGGNPCRACLGLWEARHAQ